MAALRWSSAWKIATRELRVGRGKFFFVLLSVAIGVAALTGVRSFSASFRSTLLTEARTIMAGDLTARMDAVPSPSEQKQLDAIVQQGVAMTQVTEMISMASTASDPNPVLISIKAVDPMQYPFYGSVKLSPAGALRDVLTDDSVVVGNDLLDRTHASIGDTLRLNGKNFRIAVPPNAPIVRYVLSDRSAVAKGSAVMIKTNPGAQAGLVTVGKGVTPPM